MDDNIIEVQFQCRNLPFVQRGEEIQSTKAGILNRTIARNALNCLIQLQVKNGNKWDNIGATEMIENQQAPKFQKTFRLRHRFGQHTELRAEIWDHGKPKILFGATEFCLGDLILGKVTKRLIACPEEMYSSNNGDAMLLISVKNHRSVQINKVPITRDFARAEWTVTQSVGYRSALKRFTSATSMIVTLQQSTREKGIEKTEIVWRLNRERGLKPGTKIVFDLPLHHICGKDESKGTELLLVVHDCEQNFIGLFRFTLNELLNEKRDVYEFVKDDKLRGQCELSAFSIHAVRRNDEAILFDYVRTRSVRLVPRILIQPVASPKVRQNMRLALEQIYNELRPYVDPNSYEMYCLHYGNVERFCASGLGGIEAILKCQELICEQVEEEGGDPVASTQLFSGRSENIYHLNFVLAASHFMEVSECLEKLEDSLKTTVGILDMTGNVFDRRDRNLLQQSELLTYVRYSSNATHIAENVCNTLARDFCQTV